jgi:hypothetical protein
MDLRVTGEEIRMTDQNQQDSPAEDMGLSANPSANVDEVCERPSGVAADPHVEAIANDGAGSTNRIYAYGAAVAATLGIVAGIVFASFAGQMSARSAASTNTSTNSSAAGLAALMKPQTPATTDAITPPADLAGAEGTSDPQPVAAGHRKGKKRKPVTPGAFAIEGDDELVGFDPSKGVIQTSARKVFLVSSSIGGDISAKWQDGPSNIHYKCDLNAYCTLTRKGAAVLYAKLKN